MLPLENSWACKRQNQERRSFLFLLSRPVFSSRRWLTAPDSACECWERSQLINGAEDGNSRFIMLGEQKRSVMCSIMWQMNMSIRENVGQQVWWKHELVPALKWKDTYFLSFIRQQNENFWVLVCQSNKFWKLFSFVNFWWAFFTGKTPKTKNVKTIVISCRLTLQYI